MTGTPDLSALGADFTWGVATSAYQIEGGAAVGGRSPSIWDTFASRDGTVVDGSSGAVATDHIHRFTEDVALLHWLGVDAYRLSLSWSRILPAGLGEVNREGVRFYRDLLRALRDAGITPYVTLYHWDLPQVLEDRGGWRSPESVGWFAEYAAVAKHHLGDLVSHWSTINEPYCVAFLGHGSGVHAPGITDPAAAHLCAHHLVLAHHAAVAALRDTDPDPDDRISVALNVIPAEPATDSPHDVAAAAAVDAIHNGLFLEGIFAGRYPDAIESIQHRLGLGAHVDRDRLAGTMVHVDELGVNYYNVNRFRAEPGAPAPADFPGADGARLVPPDGPITDMGWGVEPAGLGRVLDRLASRLPGLPLLITENGAAYPDETVADGIIDDGDRTEYLSGHIDEVARAAARGVDVRGYFVWSLLDNFEWSYGFTKRFGIVHVEPETLQRKPKRSAAWYRDLLARR